MSALRRNIGAEITSRMLGQAVATAAGTGDATELDSASFDRVTNGRNMLSAKLIVAVEATLQSGATLSVAANMQDSADDSAFADFGTALANAVVLTGPSGGGVARGVRELDVDLSAARRYIRAQATPDLSATGTDTCTMAVVIVLGGGDELPAS